MDDEIRTFADGRPAAPPYPEEARARARGRLLREAREGRGFRLPKLGWQAVAAFGVTVALVGGVAVALSARQPNLGVAASATQSAAVSADELRPRPGQFILVETDGMVSSTPEGGGSAIRFMSRTHRKIWQSVDASADGLLLMEGQEPPRAGEPLPKKQQVRASTMWARLASCQSQFFRVDYAYLSTLPADPATMRDFLYKRESGGKRGADEVAFTAVGDLLRETYMPRAQRDALFEAAKTIPGVQVEEGAMDFVRRKGVALGRASVGILHQLIFDRDTHVLLGERHTVVDAKAVGVPVGSELTVTAQLKVSVVDRLPKPTGTVIEDGGCAPQPTATPEPADQPTDQPTDPPTDQPPASGPAEDPTVAVPSALPSDLPEDPAADPAEISATAQPAPISATAPPAPISSDPPRVPTDAPRSGG
ncbi:CU044_5270 family protein [Nonomuraea sp. NEAU-A123]|uniref:CU044_5270 family protein n=1 Tax=Nonomuraea sp. NEAU-A123 TaxID=2839649 RepID=UPI001BE3DC8D|nr:CU044_5270 family protein [Nonomuraea sp. NEAU-A123]MBT2229442.1 CU044_5270 family protein [Nonomuraea sp. NEAU-A123]